MKADNTFESEDDFASHLSKLHKERRKQKRKIGPKIFSQRIQSATPIGGSTAPKNFSGYSNLEYGSELRSRERIVVSHLN